MSLSYDGTDFLGIVICAIESYLSDGMLAVERLATGLVIKVET